jgi:hypothetical protein
LALLECSRKNIVQANAKTAVKEVFQSQGLTAFQNGLEDKIKLAVIASRPENLVQALQVAISARNISETSQPQTTILISKTNDICHRCQKKGHWATTVKNHSIQVLGVEIEDF